MYIIYFIRSGYFYSASSVHYYLETLSATAQTLSE